MTSLLGACLLSAAGFLPVHVLPVLVAVVVAEGRGSITQAGWMGTAYMMGQLVVAIGLPMRAGPLQRAHAFLIGISLLGCLLSSAFGTAAILIAAWFFIGAASGALFYLGTLFAAAFRDVALAFSLRLSVSLFVAGMALLAVQLLTGSATYLQVVQGLSIGLAVILAIGLTFYRSHASALTVSAPKPATPSNGWVALTILYLLFVGQIGYWAFALKTSAHLDMPKSQALGAIAACKILAALMMWPLSYRERRQSISNGFLVPGTILSTGILVAVNANLPFIFVAGLLLWEIGFNVLSARLQTKAVHLNRLHSGSWITAAIFLGAATGPAMQGYAMAHGLEGVFIAVAIGCALLPSLWEQWLQRSASSPATAGAQRSSLSHHGLR